MRELDSTAFFHVCTDGRSLPWMFQDESDFIAGVNRIGICHLRTKVKVIAYVLMTNHVHFVLRGRERQCKKFITLYKQLTGTWVHAKYGLNDYLKQLPVNIILLDTEERLLNTIAYIDRNPVIAGYRFLPTEYPWGSARYIFRSTQDDMDTKYLSTFSIRNQRVLLGTRIKLPGEWRVDNKGMICPYSFIDLSIVETYFKTPVRYSYFLAKKLEGSIEMEIESSRKDFISDKELREIVKKLIQEEYNKSCVAELDLDGRLSIAKKLRYRYGSTLKQISRMVHIEMESLNGFV